MSKIIAYRLEPVYEHDFSPGPRGRERMFSAAVMSCMVTGQALAGMGGGGEYLSPVVVDGFRIRRDRTRAALDAAAVTPMQPVILDKAWADANLALDAIPTRRVRITDRIDEAVCDAMSRGLKPQAIYLDEAGFTMLKADIDESAGYIAFNKRGAMRYRGARVTVLPGQWRVTVEGGEAIEIKGVSL